MLSYNCIQTATLESRGISPLITALNSVGGWPIIGDNSVYKDSTYDWKDSFVKIYLQLSGSPIFSISVGPDAKQALVNKLNVSIIILKVSIILHNI